MARLWSMFRIKKNQRVTGSEYGLWDKQFNKICYVVWFKSVFEKGAFVWIYLKVFQKDREKRLKQ